MKPSILSLVAVLAIAPLAVPMLGCEGKVSSNPTGGPGPLTCAAGQTACGSQCVNAASDPQNCGACGKVCAAGQTCQSGSCQCAAGLLACNGVCLTPDSSHCSSCTAACQAGQVCNAGACSSSCAAGTTTCSNGACVVTNGNDPLNCGGCGTTCPVGAACNAGICGCSVAGQMLCGSGCIDTNTNTANCGSCGHACAGNQTCTNGVCMGVMTTGTAGTGGSSGAAGATGTGGSGAGGATGLGGLGGAGASGAPFEPVAAAAAVRKVKNLLVGLAPTDAEIASVTSSGQMGLQTLINGWISDQTTGPMFQAKMIAFFRNYFQQTGFQATEDFKIQLLQNGGFDFGPIGTAAVGDDAFFRLVQNLQDSFALTAWGIVANKQPFSDVLTTQKFMMTTGLKSLYVEIETVPDAPYNNGSATPAWTIDYSGNPITLDMALTNMTFSDEAPASGSTGFGLGSAQTCRDAGAATGAFKGTSLLFQRLLGFTPRLPFAANPTCFEHASKPYFTTGDMTDWQWVTITHNATPTTRPATLSYQLPTLRPLTTLALSLPRVGFYTTPAYLALWNTNDSNQHRVTANQTLLVALGQALSSANSIVPLSMPGLDNAHSVAGTECYGCHKLLDPLRQFWAAEYDFNDRNDFPAANRFTGGGANPRPATAGGVLAFDNVNTSGANMYALGPLLLQVTDEQVAGQVVSRFAMSVTQQLCYFANSSGCLETDPEFRRVALAFQNDSYQFPTLIRELFSSPLVTNAATTMTTDQNGVNISISRRDQICASLSNRLGITDICSLAVPLPTSAQNTTLKIVNSVATDAFSRGSEIPVTPSDPTLFYRAASEMLCENVAGKVVDVSGAMYQSSSYTTAIQDMVSRVVGYSPSDSHYTMAVQILTEHYSNALASTSNTGSATAKATNALRSTFALACQSPTSLSFGL